jgi:DNA-binding transcriptional LysR family regulator
MEQEDIIETEQLRAFEAVAETRSFTRAAALLGTAQSSVSQQIGRLEKRVGQLLIQRTTRRVDLTHAGSSMLVYARSILAMADDARRRLGVPPIEGVLRVGIADEFATTKLSSVLAMFRLHHPRFEMRFLTGRNDHLCAALEAGDVDMILGKSHSDRKRGELLWQEQLAWIGHSRVLRGANDPVPIVVYLRPSQTLDVMEKALLEARQTWTVVAQSDNLLGLLAAVDGGLGVTALGRNFIPPGFTEIPAAAGLPRLGTLDYILDRRSMVHDPAIDAFADALRGFARHLLIEEVAPRTSLKLQTNRVVD